MIGKLEPRDRRVLWIGAVALGGMLLLVRGVPAWWTWRADVRATTAETLARWRESEHIVQGLPSALDTLEARTQRLRRIGPVFLTGASPAEAGAALAGLLGEIARTAHVRLDAINVHVDTAAAAQLALVRVDAQATGDVAGLAELLRGLEQGPVLLAVRRLSVRAVSPHDGPESVETLGLRLSVEGIALLRQGAQSR